jgi:diguanylate cyclase (GGDEF)-like protein
MREERGQESLLSPRTTADQARFTTRFLGQMLLGGAGLTAVLSVLLGLSGGPPGSEKWWLVYSASLVAAVVGLALVVRRSPAPPNVLAVIPSAAALLIAVTMASVGSNSLSGLMLLTWPVLFAGYLLPVVAAYTTLGVVLASMTVVVTASDAPQPLAIWVELATSVTLTLAVIMRLRAQADQLHAALAEQARTDPLTGLDNRRAFTEALDREFTRHRRYRQPLSLLAVDVDHFKVINDTHGHAAGDRTLKALAELLEGLVRASDTVGRVGGEEFGVLMPDCGERQALARGRALRAAVHYESQSWEHAITVSIGVATVPDSAWTVDELQDAADTALYAAKGAGRNRVTAAAADGSADEGPDHSAHS